VLKWQEITNKTTNEQTNIIYSNLINSPTTFQVKTARRHPGVPLAACSEPPSVLKVVVMWPGQVDLPLHDPPSSPSLVFFIIWNPRKQSTMKTGVMWLVIWCCSGSSQHRIEYLEFKLISIQRKNNCGLVILITFRILRITKLCSIGYKDAQIWYKIYRKFTSYNVINSVLENAKKKF